MSTDLDPIIGNWYQGELFRVVAVDDDRDLLEIQHFDGDVEELERSGWGGLDLEAAEPPEDWTGPVDTSKRTTSATAKPTCVIATGANRCRATGLPGKSGRTRFPRTNVTIGTKARRARSSTAPRSPDFVVRVRNRRRAELGCGLGNHRGRLRGPR